MMKNETTLNPVQLIRGFSAPQQPPGVLKPEIWGFLTKIGTVRTVAKKTILFSAGEPLQKVSLVVSGLVALQKNETILDLVEPGQSIAGALLPGSDKNSTYPISAFALTDCEILEIGVFNFRTELLENAKVQLFFSQQLQQRMKLVQKSRALQNEPLSARIAFFILAKRELFERGQLTRKVIGQACNTTTESVIRQLSVWEKDGVLKQIKRKTTILQEQVLESLCAYNSL